MLPLYISTVDLPPWIASRTSVVVISSITTRGSVAAAATVQTISPTRLDLIDRQNDFIGVLRVSESFAQSRLHLPPSIASSPFAVARFKRVISDDRTTAEWSLLGI